MSRPIRPEDWKTTIAPRVEAFFRKRLHNKDAAEDLTQDTWVRCGRTPVPEDKRPFPWAMQMASWVLKDYLRREMRRPDRANIDGFDQSLSGHVAPPDDPSIVWKHILKRLSLTLQESLAYIVIHTYNSLPLTSKHRRDAQRLRDERHICSVVSRREFMHALEGALVAVSVPTRSVGSGTRVTPDLQPEHLVEFLSFVERLRTEAAGIVLARAFIDELFDLLKPADIGTAAHKAAVIRLLDLRTSLALDEFDFPGARRLVSQMRKLHSPCTVSACPRCWRLSQLLARSYFHEDNFHEAYRCYADVTGASSPSRFLEGNDRLDRDRMGHLRGIVARDLGSLARKQEDWERNREWLSAASEFFKNAGDSVEAARVECQLLRADVESHRRDAGRARDTVQQLSDILRYVPKIVTSDMYLLQHGFCEFPALLIADHDGAQDCFARLAHKVQRLGYLQGAFSLHRSIVKLAQGTFREKMIKESGALVRLIAAHRNT